MNDNLNKMITDQKDGYMKRGLRGTHTNPNTINNSRELLKYDIEFEIINNSIKFLINGLPYFYFPNKNRVYYSNQESTNLTLKQFIIENEESFKPSNGDIFPFGIHKGNRICNVLVTDIQYIEWVINKNSGSSVSKKNKRFINRLVEEYKEFTNDDNPKVDDKRQRIYHTMPQEDKIILFDVIRDWDYENKGTLTPESLSKVSSILLPNIKNHWVIFEEFVNQQNKLQMEIFK